MSDIKHTPGPWFYWEDAIYSGTPSIKRRGHLEGYDKQICEMDDLDTTKKELKANAHLIAAAPDLLDVATWLIRIADGKYHNDDAAEHFEALASTARVAIAKATGKE